MAKGTDGSVGPLGLAIEPGGRPGQPLRCIRLDDWHHAGSPEIARAAEHVATSLPLSVGIATRPPVATLDPLLDALTLTLAGPEAAPRDRRLIVLSDPGQAAAELTECVAHRPQASVALGQLLRQTSSLETLPGLGAEAAVYSMLLGGGEFAEWLADRGNPPPAGETDRPLVRIDRDGGQLSLALDQPERRNALSFRMREALLEALEVACLDDTIGQVELSGRGPVFCSGGDLAEFGTATDLVAAYMVRLERAPWRLLDRLRDRLTVRIQGAAIGAGIEMAAFAGHVAATPETFFLLPEIRMGLVPGAGGTVSVPRRIGRWRAAWMMLGGGRVDAKTALDWGLVDELTEA